MTPVRTLEIDTACGWYCSDKPLVDAPNKTGVYHVEAKGEKYTGSAGLTDDATIASRTNQSSHPARDLFDDPNKKTTFQEVDVSDLESKSDRNRALRVAEQDMMDAKENVPNTGGSRNQRRALSKKKIEKYRQQYNVDDRKK